MPIEEIADPQMIITTPQLSPQQQHQQQQLQQVQQQQMVVPPPPQVPPPPPGLCAYPTIIGAPGLPTYFSAEHIRFPVPPPGGTAIIQEHVIEVIRSRPSLNEQQQYEQAGSSNWVPPPPPPPQSQQPDYS
ncbi:hypothetical protein Trydic_g10215 [Trypoxylus dichotomus]